MKYSSRLHLTAAAAAVFAALAASSSAAVAAEETVSTETVKVTASRVEKELMDVNMSVSVITAEQIEQSGARNVGEILQYIPGITINNDGGQGKKTIKIRGERADRSRIMIDGQRISEHKAMVGSAAAILIDPSMIERIEVIKGPASVLYGSDAIGGVVNIITKKGGKKAFQADVSAGLNTSASGKDAAVTLSGSNEGWNYRLNASVESNDNFDTPKGEMPNTYFKSRSVGGFLSYDLTSDLTVGGSVDYYDMEFGSTAISQPGFAVDVPKWERTKGAVFVEARNISDVLTHIRADAYFQQNKKDMTNTVPGVWSSDDVQQFIDGGFKRPMLNMFGVIAGNPYTLQPHASNKLKQYGFSIQSDWQLGDSNYLVAGYEFSYDDLDADSWNTGTNTMPMMLTSKTYTGHQMTNAVFASMETELPADLTLNYGVRYTWVSSEMKMHNNKSGADTKFSSASDSKAVFNAGILWHGVDNLVLRANYSQGYRNPILQELYVDTSMGSNTSTTKANPDLKPETSDNFEIGARWTPGKAVVDATLFYSEADNYIAALQKNAYLSQYENIAKAKTFGFELATSLQLGTTGFEPFANLTFLRRQFDNGNGFKTWNSETPAVTAQYGIRWVGEHDGLGLRSEIFAQSATKTKYSSEDHSEDYELAGYTTLNLTGGISFGPEKQFKLDAGLYNIMDKAYQLSTTVYEPGRYFAMKFNAHF